MNQSKIILIIASLVIVLISGVVGVYILVENVPSDDSQVSIFYVESADDDSRTFQSENSDRGYGNENGAWALLQLSPSYSFGVRFSNVTIPYNATITKAFVKLFCIGTPDASHPNCKIFGDNASNAINFTELGVLKRCGRNYTQSFTLWNESVDYSQWITTPDLKEVIQEIVGHNDWQNENALALLFVTNQLEGYSSSFQNFESGYASELVVMWK